MSDLSSQRILIIGLGLIGGSIARGLRKAVPGLQLLAVDGNEEALAAAVKEGIIDAAGTVEKLGPDADLIVLALPPLSAAAEITTLARHSKPNAVITDVTSVKSHIVDEVNKQSVEFRAQFVPGHPIAGSERSGYTAASDNLFAGRNVILTPQAETDPDALSLVNNMWRLLGADVLGMSISRHDEVLAATSHLPHLLAFAVVETLRERRESEDIFRYAAGGFADFSRLASSDAQMWSDIFVTNAGATAQILDAYIDKLQGMKELLVNNDRDTLKAKFVCAKQTRDRFISRYFNTGHTSNTDCEKITYRVKPGGRVSGDIRIPGDKSISHRAVILGALADGVTHITGFLQGEDALNTVAAFREMGVTIVGPENGVLTIYGVGKTGLQAPRKPLYMGNSGTAMRLLAGLLAAQPFASELIGDESLNRRPMNRVADPLREMGAIIETGDNGTPPMKIKGARLHGISHAMQIASAQVKSCLLLAGMYAEGETEVIEPAPTRDHTERMLAGFGYPTARDNARGSITIDNKHSLQATDIDVPADISSAAFFLVAASIIPGASLRIRHVGINPTRTGVINILRAMGGQITLENESVVGGEPVADLVVQSAGLKGITIPEDQIPLAIDEFPVLFIAAACAEGETLLRGAEELRVKESDRIQAMANGLTALGVEVETFADGIRIVGGELGGGEIDSCGDHRIAMAFTIAGLRAAGEIRIRDCANVATSFPGFIELAGRVGIQVSQQKS